MPHEFLTVGRVEVIPLCDGWDALPLAEEVPGHDVDWSEERRRHPWAFPPAGEDGWAWHVHAFVVRLVGGGVVLVDTGIGHLGPPRYDVTGRIEEELRVVGMAPRDVDHVVYTHLHADHSGGACRPDGSPRFPNARHHVHREDWTFFGTRPTPEAFTGRDAMSALEETGMLDLDGDDHAIAAGVHLVHAPGHTPGHRIVRIDDGNDELLLTGDLVHVPPQVASPAWLSNHDENPELASRTRARWIEAARTNGWLIGVSHFGRPFGRVEDGGWSSI
jgi:glyoxylase-like metal-dependent hydrolase (beta-lactamase superfamily II)